MYASELGIDQFTGSNGWLENWQKRHNVRIVVLSGEAADVDPTVVSDWSERLKTSSRVCFERSSMLMKLASSIGLCLHDQWL